MHMNPIASPRRRRTIKRRVNLLRIRVAIAFRDMAKAVDAPAAQRQAVRFYRSSGMPWASGLV
jgi:hypothetical protein